MQPIWRTADDDSLGSVPAWMRSWIIETGSLTQRLKTCCPGAFSLEVIGEREVAMGADDARVMGLETGAAARVREVSLCCGGEPRIRAKSVLPRTTLDGPARSLDGIGTRPLGDALFTLAGVERGPIEVAHTADGWARRSVFRIDGAPLLVGEWFLEALERCDG